MWARASTLRLLESPQSPDTFSLYTLIRCRQGGGEGAHRHGAHIAAGELHSNRPAQTGCASQGWWSGKLRGSFEGPLSNVPHEGGCLGRVLAPIDRRSGAEEEGGVGHGGAGAGASLHRED